MRGKFYDSNVTLQVDVDIPISSRYIEHQGREDMGQAWLELK